MQKNTKSKNKKIKHLHTVNGDYKNKVTKKQIKKTSVPVDSILVPEIPWSKPVFW